jgi:hypothetical protein
MKHGLFSSRAQPQATTMWFVHVMTQILSCLDEAEIMTWFGCLIGLFVRGMGLVDEVCVRVLEYFQEIRWR